MKFVSSCILFLFVSHLWASDSLVNNYYWYLNDAARNPIAIDTGVGDNEQLGIIQFDAAAAQTGRMGQPVYPLEYRIPDGLGFEVGIAPFASYQWSLDEIRRYSVRRPYAEIDYSIGFDASSIIEGKHSQSISKSKNVNYGLHFKRLNTFDNTSLQQDGVFPNEQAQLNGMWYYVTHQDSAQKNEITAYGLYNIGRVQDNGGLDTSYFDRISRADFFPELIGVNSTDGRTEWREYDLHIKDRFYLQNFLADTIQPKNLGFEVDLGIRRNRFKYIDESPDSTFHKAYFNEDSAVVNYLHRTYSQQLNVFYDIQNKFYVWGGLQFRQQRLSIYEQPEIRFSETMLQGGLERLTLTTPKWKFTLSDIEASLVLNSRFNAGDYQLKGTVSTGNDWLDMYVKAQSLRKSPTYVQQQIGFDSYTANYNFKPQFIQQITGGVDAYKDWLTLELSQIVLGNGIYFNEFARPRQLDETSTFTQFKLKTHLRAKGVHFIGFAQYNLNSNRQEFRIPKLYLNGKLFYQNKLFKGALAFQIGTQVNWWSGYLPMGYDPHIGQFHLDFSRHPYQLTPLMDVFANFKVRTVRISIFYRNLLQGLEAQGYHVVNAYPAPQRTLYWNLTWRFLD